MKHCENTTVNVRIIGNQEFYAWQSQFEGKTDTEIMGQISRFETDAVGELAKGNKHRHTQRTKKVSDIIKA